MPDLELLQETFEIQGGDFLAAGQVSSAIKKVIRQLGLPPSVIRRVSIASYEAEMNMVSYARRGRVVLRVTDDRIRLEFQDEGPGIADIEQAMVEGFSTASDAIREMGFGAGMGLPNIRRNSDEFEISSTIGQGTQLCLVVYTGESRSQVA